MIADYEDLQETEVSEIDVKRFENQEAFVKGDYEFPCANGTLRLPRRPRPSSTAEGNMEQEEDVESDEENDSMIHDWRIYLSTSSRISFEGSLKLYVSDYEPLLIRLKYVDVMRQTQTCVNNVSENIIDDI